MFTRFLFMLAPFVLISHLAHGQLLSDTLFTWKGYASKPGICKLKLYKNPQQDKKKYTAVITELGENTGPSSVEDIGYLAEHIGRTYSVDPTQVYWVIHWGHFSFKEATESKKELFIRATFSRTSTQRIGAPQWRLITRKDIEKYTDRHFLW